MIISLSALSATKSQSKMSPSWSQMPVHTSVQERWAVTNVSAFTFSRKKLEGGHVGLKLPRAHVGLCHSDPQHSSEQVRNTPHLGSHSIGLCRLPLPHSVMIPMYPSVFSFQEEKRGGAEVLHTHRGGKPTRLPCAPRPSSSHQEPYAASPLPFPAKRGDPSGVERWNCHTSV